MPCLIYIGCPAPEKTEICYELVRSKSERKVIGVNENFLASGQERAFQIPSTTRKISS